MIRYRTVLKEAEAQQVIERSKFIAHIKPVETKEEADEFIASVRLAHRTATHNVPAFVIGEKMELQWASDDGEPQGTSGAPMAQLLVKEGITNTAVVVTRYFGGIKLGTGGLVRAYTGSLKEALKEAGVCEVRDMVILTVRINYSYLAKLQSLAAAGNSMAKDCMPFAIEEITYTDAVVLRISVSPENQQALRVLLANLTSGTGEILTEENELVKVPVID